MTVTRACYWTQTFLVRRATKNTGAPWTEQVMLPERLIPADSFSRESPNRFASVADELHSGSTCVAFWLAVFQGSACTKHFEVGKHFEVCCIPRNVRTAQQGLSFRLQRVRALQESEKVKFIPLGFFTSNLYQQVVFWQVLWHRRRPFPAFCGLILHAPLIV